MNITHFGHACLLVEIGDARILLDPGTFSTGFTQLTDLDAVLVTHQHFDHLDVERVAPLLAANPAASLIVEKATANSVAEQIPGDRIQIVSTGDTFDVNGVALEVVGGTHATIHADVPVIPNIGFYFTDTGLLHPGDEFSPPSQTVEVLALPISGPWQKLNDVVEYLRAINPTMAFPIHEAVTSRPALVHGYLENLKPPTTVFQVLDPQTTTAL